MFHVFRSPKRASLARSYDSPMYDSSTPYGTSSFGNLQDTELQAKPFKSTGLPQGTKLSEDLSSGFVNPNFGVPPPKSAMDSNDIYATVGSGVSRRKPTDSQA